MSPGKVVHSFCRICNNHCAIKVQVEDGAAIRVTGDADNPLFGGYTCVKGRAQAQFLRGEERLRHSLKRDADNSGSQVHPKRICLAHEKFLAVWMKWGAAGPPPGVAVYNRD